MKTRHSVEHVRPIYYSIFLVFSENENAPPKHTHNNNEELISDEFLHNGQQRREDQDACKYPSFSSSHTVSNKK